jgi:gamma-glutamylcyclotransferase (GGCT)/AIG2-like uncharacterized protein YtfP
MSETKRIAVYGTLKRGFYNYDRFNHFYEFKFVGSERIKGFSLYDLGHYPAAVESDPENEITIEIFDVSPACYKSLHEMEISAGYVKKEVATSHGCAILWAYENEPRYSKLIESGIY